MKKVMKKIVCFLLVAALFPVYRINAQTTQDPDNAVQISHNFDQSQGLLVFYADNRDFCDYYLYLSFVYAEGFEGIMSGALATTAVGPGRRQIKTYKVREGASRYSYNYRFAIYRGDSNKKPNIDFVYSLPTAASKAVTAIIMENPEGYQLTFDLPLDTVYACRGGVMCNDKLKDNTTKGHEYFDDNRNLSQITIYHNDGSFGEYIFKGKALIDPGQNIKMGTPIAVVEKTNKYLLYFSVYFLDKNKLQNLPNNNIGNKHTHFRPFFQTENEGKTRLQNGITYLCKYTDEMLMQDMSKREKKKFLKDKSK
jgi:hypothetical protein